MFFSKFMFLPNDVLLLNSLRSCSTFREVLQGLSPEAKVSGPSFRADLQDGSLNRTPQLWFASSTRRPTSGW